MRRAHFLKLVDIFYDPTIEDFVTLSIMKKSSVLSTLMSAYEDNAVFEDANSRRWKLVLSNVDMPILMCLTKDTPTFFITQLVGLHIDGFRFCGVDSYEREENLDDN